MGRGDHEPLVGQQGLGEFEFAGSTEEAPQSRWTAGQCPCGSQVRLLHAARAARGWQPSLTPTVTACKSPFLPVSCGRACTRPNPEWQPQVPSFCLCSMSPRGLPGDQLTPLLFWSNAPLGPDALMTPPCPSLRGWCEGLPEGWTGSAWPPLQLDFTSRNWGSLFPLPNGGPQKRRPSLFCSSLP